MWISINSFKTLFITAVSIKTSGNDETTWGNVPKWHFKNASAFWHPHDAFRKGTGVRVVNVFAIHFLLQ